VNDNTGDGQLIEKLQFSPKKMVEKLMVPSESTPSESTPQELSNEWHVSMFRQS
jgi:hypothetical protein